MSTRALSTREINILAHLLTFGGAGVPVILSREGTKRATALWRLGLVNVWHRQSLHGGRTEGPFYSLTMAGRSRAVAFLASREHRSDPSLSDLDQRAPACHEIAIPEGEPEYV